MCKIVDIFYGQNEIAELLFPQNITVDIWKARCLLSDVVRAIDKTLPYNWEWDCSRQKMRVPQECRKIDVNERLRKSIMIVVEEYRKEMLP